ncbi:hypothetical protein [Bacillus sp. MRMR6]|uniref:hypothetical protein n=1 Tax=Bacillus sp. MRMR6 TaxID=1928617 RepID=UPI0015889CDF|nr:hypothetical protein [Bacillus sp. MRMR6]
MIVSLLLTLIIIIAGMWVVLGIYDLFKSEIARSLLIQAYGLFAGLLTIRWIMISFF